MAALTIITLLTLTGLFQRLPQATWPQWSSIELIDLPALATLYRVYTRRLGRYYGVAARPDFIAAVAALLGVLIFDTLPAVHRHRHLAAAADLPRLPSAHRRAGKVPGTAGQYGDRERHPKPGAARHRDPGESDLLRQRRRGQAKPAPTPPKQAAGWSPTPRPPTIDVTAVHARRTRREPAARGRPAAGHREIGQVRDVVGQVATDTTPEGVYPTVQAVHGPATPTPPVQG